MVNITKSVAIFIYSLFDECDLLITFSENDIVHEFITTRAKIL